MVNEFNVELASYMAELTAFAMRLTKKNEADAQDLVQNTLQNALRYRDKFEMGTNMKSWLFTIMKNQFINTYRRRQRFHEIAGEKPTLLGQDNTQGRAETYVTGRAELEYLVENLRKALPPEFLEVLILVDVHDKSYREAAELTNVPVGTIMSRLYRSRKRCREYLLKNYNRDLLEDAVPSEALAKAEVA